jgi:hypothetical protein
MGTLPGRRAAALAAAAAVMLLAWSCKSPTAPSGGEADITVTSHWDTAVNVYMDGAFRFPLSYKESAEIDNVSVKNHVLEAKDQATGTLVASTTLEVTDKSEYTWTIEHRARINCDSIFGETLNIYMDGVYQFDLANGENHWIINVPLGNHFLMAIKASDGKEAASITMKVTENTDYGWGIHIITGVNAVGLASN